MFHQRLHCADMLAAAVLLQNWDGLCLIVRSSHRDMIIVYRKRDAFWVAKSPQNWFWYVAEAACVLDVVCDRHRELCGILCPFCHVNCSGFTPNDEF